MKREAAALLLVAALLTGCVEQNPPSSQRTVSSGNVVFSVPFDFQPTTSSGYAVFSIESTQNASFFLEHRYEWDTNRDDPLEIISVDADGKVTSPGTLRTEYADAGMDWDNASSTPIEINAGPVDQHRGGASGGIVQANGADFTYSSTKSRLLLVMWANVAKPPMISTMWLEGTRVTTVAVGDSVVSTSLENMSRGTVGVTSPLVNEASERGISFGAPNAPQFVVVKVHRTYGVGTALLSDGKVARQFDVGRTTGAGATRYSMTTEGTTSVTLNATGLDALRVHVMAMPTAGVSLPPHLFAAVDEDA